MSKGRRRRGRRRGRPQRTDKQEQGAQQSGEAPKKKRRRRRRRRPAETFESFLSSAKMSEAKTLPPDGTVLEEVISDLQDSYGTPATPQEYRLLVKLPEGSEPIGDLDAFDPGPEPDGERRGRRRRRRRRRGGSGAN
jgi:hypothetical protein